MAKRVAKSQFSNEHNSPQFECIGDNGFEEDIRNAALKSLQWIVQCSLVREHQHRHIEHARITAQLYNKFQTG